MLFLRICFALSLATGSYSKKTPLPQISLHQPVYLKSIKTVDPNLFTVRVLYKQNFIDAYVIILKLSRSVD